MSKKISCFDDCVFTLVGIKEFFAEEYDVLINCVDLDEKKYSMSLSSLGDFDAVIVSIGIRNYNVLYTIKNLTTLSEYSRIIVIMDDQNYAVLQLLRCMGVSLIITRNERLSVIRDMVTNSKINNYISEGLSKLLDDVYPLPSWERTTVSNTVSNNILSPMELDILIPLINGVSPSYLARKYSISVKTVSNHKINALSKIGISNIALLFQNNIN